MLTSNVRSAAARDPFVTESDVAFHDLYPRLLAAILHQGRFVAPRGEKTYEVSPMMFTLQNPRDCTRLQKSRRINYAYAAIEKLSLLHGVADPDTFCYYVPALDGLLNEQGVFGGAYGPRVTGQLDYIYNLLAEDPETRRAVVTIYSSQHDHMREQDIPCTVSLQFLLRDGRLSLIANMRSSDVYLGLPYDIQQFTFLQQLLAYWLKVEPGQYVHVAGSAHVYLKDIAAAEAVIDGKSDLNTRVEPPVDIDREVAWDHARIFFRIESELRSGSIADPRQGEGYGELGGYLRYCLRRIERVTSRSEDRVRESRAHVTV